MNPPSDPTPDERSWIPASRQLSPLQSCSNCNTPLQGGFCHECGQKDINFNRPLLDALRLLLDSWYSLDNKVLRSLIPIFLRPGDLSRQFISGKRASYTSPLKLFLFSSLWFFFILGLNKNTDISFKSDIEITSDAKETLSTSPSESKELTSETDQLSGSLPKEGFWKRVERKATENPHVLKQKVMNALSYMFFALMPLFALLLKIFLKKKKCLYFQHLIFSIHLHVFGFLFLSLFIFFYLVTGKHFPYEGGVITIGLLAYILVALRNFYGMRWWVGVLRMGIILGTYSVIFITVMVTSLFIAVII